MRLSRYFLPILRETPKEAEIVSHRLMLRAGMMRQEAAGHLRVPAARDCGCSHKVCRIVREEQDRSGAIEMLMPTIQPAELWRESGRYDDYGKEMLRIKDRHERDMLYGPTNEEMITEIFRAYVRSYKDLPLNLYHLQWKFRDEVRPRFGTMRSREFLMKDAYSFDLDHAGARHSYNKMFVAYLRTFARMGLRAIPDGRRHRPDRRQSQPRIHHSRLDRRKRGFLPSRLSRLRHSGRGREFRRCRRAAEHRRYLDLALCRDLRQARAGRVRCAARRDEACRRAASRSGTSSISAPNIPCRCVRVVAGPDGAEHAVHMGSYGIGPTPARRRHHRGLPRRCGHQVAGSGGAVQGRDPQPQAGRWRDRRGVARRSTGNLSASGVEVLYNDLEERPGAKFAADRPDRHSRGTFWSDPRDWPRARSSSNAAPTAAAR